jgi:hypothetical protein
LRGNWDPQHGPTPHLAAFKRVPPYPHPDGTPESRRRATDEKYAIDERRLAHLAKQSEHARREQLRNHLNLAALAFIWCAVGVAFAGLVVWTIHVLGPESWHFLTPQQISKVESIATTGSVITLIAKYFKDRL